MWRRWWNGVVLWSAARGRARARLSGLWTKPSAPGTARQSKPEQPASSSSRHRRRQCSQPPAQQSKAKPRQPASGSSRHRRRHCPQPPAQQKPSPDSRPAAAHAAAAATARSPKHGKSKPGQPACGSSRRRRRHCPQPHTLVLIWLREDLGGVSCTAIILSSKISNSCRYFFEIRCVPIWVLGRAFFRFDSVILLLF